MLPVPFALRTCAELQLLLKVKILVKKKKPKMPLNDRSSVRTMDLIWFHYHLFVGLASFFCFFARILLNVIKIYEHFELPSDLLDEPSWKPRDKCSSERSGSLALVLSDLSDRLQFASRSQLFPYVSFAALGQLNSWIVEQSVMSYGSSWYCPPMPMQWHAVIPGTRHLETGSAVKAL